MADSTYGPVPGEGLPISQQPGFDEDSEAIRADIGETRRRMSHALDEIGDRMNPQHLKEQAKIHVRDATIGRAEDMARNTANRAREAQHSIMDTIRDNPLPSAITGIGLGWLIWNGRKHDDRNDQYYGYRYNNDPYRAYGYTGPQADMMGDRYAGGGEGFKDKAEDFTDRARESLHETRDRTREAAGEMTDRAHDFAERAVSETRNAAHSLAEEARHRTHRLEDRFQDTMRTNPMAVGAAAAAVGLAIGLSAPASRHESELMGDASDRLKDRARHATREAAEKVSHVAEEAVHQGGEAARETARQEGLTH